MPEFFLALGLISMLVGFFVLFRNSWVYAQRTAILKTDHWWDLKECYPSYGTMVLKFWIWDINKFRNPPPTHWSATGDGATLFSDDFVYNARLQLEGDFPSPQERKDYAERLAERLNGAHYG